MVRLNLKTTMPIRNAGSKRSEGPGFLAFTPPRGSKTPALTAISAARDGGAVMVIALLAIVLIASLIFYVINVGQSVQGRVVTQHAADAAAVGGAAQVARSMNAVAMNNVESARLIATINVLDGLPLAVDMSITSATEEELGDVDALDRAVSVQLRSGVVDVWFKRLLEKMMDPSDPESVVSEKRHLQELDELLRSQPDLIPELTWYEAPSGERGKMHQALHAMDAYSRAAMQTMSESAQLTAASSARANLGSDDVGVAGLLLPVNLWEEGVHWRRGVFDDFERPVKQGLLPGGDSDTLTSDTLEKGLGQVDDTVIRRGPWDAVFGWRFTDGQIASPGRLPGINFPPLVGAATTQGEAEEYWVFGPQFFLLRSFPRRPYSRVRSYLWSLNSIKTNYLWPGTTDRTVLKPDWEIDISHDDERSTDHNGDFAYGLSRGEIRETLFVVGEIKSSTPNNPGNPASEGVTWSYITGDNRDSPFAYYRGGWADPRDGPPIRINPKSVKSPPTWTKVQDYIWRLSAIYETDPEGPELGGDLSIGLPPKRAGTTPDGKPIYAAQEVYWEIDVMFVGVNVGEQVRVNDPWDNFDRNSEEAPAPVDFVHEQILPDDEDTLRRHLTFLGVARKPNRADFWTTRFDGDRAYRFNTGIAQARVFNNHSWDLWTQTWQAQLEPVTEFNLWVRHAEAAANAADNPGLAPGVDPDAAREIAEHLQSLRSLAPVMLNH